VAYRMMNVCLCNHSLSELRCAWCQLPLLDGEPVDLGKVFCFMLDQSLSPTTAAYGSLPMRVIDCRLARHSDEDGANRVEHHIDFFLRSMLSHGNCERLRTHTHGKKFLDAIVHDFDMTADTRDTGDSSV